MLGAGSHSWGATRTSTANKSKVVANLSPLITASRYWVTSLSLVQQEDALTDVGFTPSYSSLSYKRVTQFSEFFLCLQFLKNNHLEIINTPKRHILGQQNLLPFPGEGENVSGQDNDPCLNVSAWDGHCLSSMPSLLLPLPEGFFSAENPFIVAKMDGFPPRFWVDWTWPQAIHFSLKVNIYPKSG